MGVWGPRREWGGGMRLAVILVHYKTPELTAAAVEHLRRDLDESGREAEILVVDNGGDAPGRALLEALPGRRIDAGGNRGYAGGVNLGVAETTAEAIVVMNPDVLVRPGCLAGLLGELEDGADIVGPRFYWDADGRFLLPPAEPRGPLIELRRAAAGPTRAARRRWQRHAYRYWSATRALDSWALSGAMIGLRRECWGRVGPFDEGYRLYFEETDWLRRARRAGCRCRYQPLAEAVHLWGRSASVEPRARQWFEDSSRRFRRRHYGAWVSALLAWLERRATSSDSAQAIRAAKGDVAVDLATLFNVDATCLQEQKEIWLELSPSPAGFPAAAERLWAGGEVPEDPGREDSLRRWTSTAGVRRHLRTEALFLRLAGDRQDELSDVVVKLAASSSEP